MSLTIWINAFIPKNVGTYTKTITRGPHAGKSAVPLPGAAWLNPINLIKDALEAYNLGYLTDQRGFSTDPKASVRMQSLVTVDFNSSSGGYPYATARLVGKKYGEHRSSGTTAVNLETGKHVGFDYADMSNCSFRRLRNIQIGGSPGRGVYQAPFGSRRLRVHYPKPPSGPPPALRLELNAEASDPLVSAAANIDYEGVFEIRVKGIKPTVKCEISFKGKIDAFPAYECYARLDGVTQTLFKLDPPKGNTVTNLPGEANRPVSAAVEFPKRK